MYQTQKQIGVLINYKDSKTQFAIEHNHVAPETVFSFYTGAKDESKKGSPFNIMV
jgi:hypothetical protein